MATIILNEWNEWNEWLKQKKATENYTENFADKITNEKNTRQQQRIMIIVHERNDQKIVFLVACCVSVSVLVFHFIFSGYFQQKLISLVYIESML